MYINQTNHTWTVISVLWRYERAEERRVEEGRGGGQERERRMIGLRKACDRDTDLGEHLISTYLLRHLY